MHKSDLFFGGLYSRYLSIVDKFTVQIFLQVKLPLPLLPQDMDRFNGQCLKQTLYSEQGKNQGHAYVPEFVSKWDNNIRLFPPFEN